VGAAGGHVPSDESCRDCLPSIKKSPVNQRFKPIFQINGSTFLLLYSDLCDELLEEKIKKIASPAKYKRILWSVNQVTLDKNYIGYK
jgi:hypothetical protein